MVSALLGALLLAGPALAQVAPGAGSPPGGELRAQLSARTITTLAAEIPGRIAELSLREGERFDKGQVLVALDCAAYKASQDKAAAVLQAKRKTLQVRNRLDQLGSVSTLEVDLAAAEVAVAEADLALARLSVDRCQIRAPFAGRVGEVLVRRWQSVAAGQEILRLLDTGDLEVELLVPSRWLAWLKPGSRFQLNLEELGRTAGAEVSRFGAAIDPVSQSIKVFGRLREPATDLLPGMSGQATFERGH